MKKQPLFTCTAVLLLLFGTILHAQKGTLSGDTILKDGAAYAILNKTGPGLGTGFRLYTIGGKELAKIENRSLPGTSKPGSSYTAPVNYQSFEFFDTAFSGGCELPMQGKKELVRLIVFHELVNGDTLNATTAQYFCEKYGHPYTKPNEKEKDKKD
jgi:hypothetical protein